MRFEDVWTWNWWCGGLGMVYVVLIVGMFGYSFDSLFYKAYIFIEIV